MTLTRPLLAFALLSGLAACTTAPKMGTEPTADLMADCTINIGNNATQMAPTWMCDEPVSEAFISAVDSAQGGEHVPVSFLKTQAAAKAMGQLAQRFSSRVASWTKAYIATTGAYSDDSLDAFSEAITTVLSQAELVGAQRLKSREVSINGGNAVRVYVLVGMNKGNTAQTLKTNIKRNQRKWKDLRQAKINTSQGNERAIWQKFNAEEAFAAMEEELLAK